MSVFIAKLGLRNLFRHKKRTVITAIVISLAILIYLVTDSLMAGMKELSFENIINLDSGHIQITTPEYWEDREKVPLEDLLILSDNLKDEIEKLDNFQVKAEQVKFSAKLNNGIDELPVTGIGIKPAQQKEVFTTENYLIEGSMIEDGKYQAVLGQSMADLMDLAVGDYITLLTRTVEGTFNTIDAEITGLLNTPNPTVNDNIVYLPLGIVQQSLNLEDQISQVVVKLKGDKHQAVDIVEILNKSLKDKNLNLRAHSWKDSAREVIAMTQAQAVESSTILGIILLIAAVGIINTTILGALERMEEIGMMKALGLKEGEIIRAFMIEAAGIGMVGGFIGWVLSAGGVLYLTKYGISMSDLVGGDMSFGLPIIDIIYGAWNIPAFVFIFVFSVVVVVLASIIPARWAAHKDPVKAIYHR